MTQRIDQIHELIGSVQHGDADAARRLRTLFMPDLLRWVNQNNPYRNEIIEEAWETLVLTIVSSL